MWFKTAGFWLIAAIIALLDWKKLPGTYRTKFGRTSVHLSQDLMILTSLGSTCADRARTDRVTDLPKREEFIERSIDQENRIESN